jgi:hypothetical protein
MSVCPSICLFPQISFEEADVFSENLHEHHATSDYHAFMCLSLL